VEVEPANQQVISPGNLPRIDRFDPLSNIDPLSDSRILKLLANLRPLKMSAAGQRALSWVYHIILFCCPSSPPPVPVPTFHYPYKT